MDSDTPVFSDSPAPRKVEVQDAGGDAGEPEATKSDAGDQEGEEEEKEDGDQEEASEAEEEKDDNDEDADEKEEERKAEEAAAAVPEGDRLAGPSLFEVDAAATVASDTVAAVAALPGTKAPAPAPAPAAPAKPLPPLGDIGAADPVELLRRSRVRWLAVRVSYRARGLLRSPRDNFVRLTSYFKAVGSRACPESARRTMASALRTHGVTYALSLSPTVRQQWLLRKLLRLNRGRA